MVWKRWASLVRVKVEEIVALTADEVMRATGPSTGDAD